MIVYAAIVPHSPLLLPSIGKEHRDKLSATLAAFSQVEQDLYLVKPDTICIIAPHGARYPDAFSINLANKYTGNFKSFGDFSSTFEAKGDFMMIDHLQRKLRDESVPFTLTSNEDLDYGFTIPLILLTSHLERWKLVPISPSLLDGKAHFEFGKQLKRVLHAEDKRVAIIASADLSHKLGPQSPGGPVADAKTFDALIVDAATNNQPTKLFDLSNEFVDKVGQCGFRPILTLLGALDEMNTTPKKLCYESPFDVGYLSASFQIN